MDYVFNKKVHISFAQAIERVIEELGKEGFGVLTEIDVTATLKKKLDVDFRNYRILGACNPTYAYKALQAEPWIGSMLPCNVIVQELETGEVEVGAVNPIASMQAVDNPALGEIALVIQKKLQDVIDRL
ncbi:DUF302 domain-containing protein [Geopsychrobacter electrodiphilus]|uniref:DUF302 domain-containing protein n=1 Tax=Geopsychrobacter electrodiphilus TaxID=225196 RepID=UPI000374003B|nr:DUF302 domain-containing protein [Geopsychrobacter electrodiphilus]